MTPIKLAPLLIVLSLLLPACKAGAGDSAEVDGSADAEAGGNAWWLDYTQAPASGRWETTTLDEARYIQVVKEIACLNRDYQGVAEKKNETTSRIYFHHQTTAADIADYGRKINLGDATEAQRIGELLATAIERCQAPTAAPAPARE